VSRSLFSRTTRTLLVSLTLMQTAILLATTLLVGWPLLRTSADDLARIMELSALGWLEIPPEKRSAFIRELAESQDLQLSPQMSPAGEISRLPFNRVLSRTLSERFGQDIVVTASASDTQYWVTLPTPQGPLSFAYPHSRIGTHPTYALAIIFLLSIAASLFVAFQLSRGITRPLRKLANAVHLAGGLSTPRLPVPTEAPELGELVARFNQMSQDVEGLLKNRATLLAGISHDLRSPIARTRVALELLRNDPDPALHADIERYLGQMNELIDQYLDFGRSSYGQKPEALDLSALAAEFVREYGPRLRVSGPALAPVVRSVALKRILRNYIENALRYAPPHAVDLSWRCQDNTLTVRVRDYGPGLPDDSDRLFVAFERGETSRNSDTGGLGLGLAIVREIAQNQGWQIGLENAPPQGAVAWLQIPGCGTSGT
jgi:two-component system osmolarity sensor histidine kinase EnvZ